MAFFLADSTLDAASDYIRVQQRQVGLDLGAWWPLKTELPTTNVQPQAVVPRASSSQQTASKAEQMRAAVLVAPGNVEVRDVPAPVCPDGGAVIRVEACSICATDVKMAERGQRDLRYPRVLGHEVSGTVIESEETAANIRVGDRVQVAPGIGCGACQACRRGADNRCERIGIIGFTHDGGFAELMAVPREVMGLAGMSPVPDGVAFEHAALSEPLACCINAQEGVQISAGDRVLVVGAGPVGCMQAMLARSRGASYVVMSERSQHRAELARRAGADDIVVSDDPCGAVRGACGSDGVDAVVFACRAAPLGPYVDLLRPGGRMCLFSGLPHGQAALTLDANEVHYRELQIVGAYGCTARQNAAAVELIATGAVDVSWLITKRVALDQIADGLSHVASGEGMRAVVTTAEDSAS